MPLSVLYFSVVVTLVAVSFSTFGLLVAQYGFHMPVIQYFQGQDIFLPLWSVSLIVLGGILLLTGTMHLIKGIGILQGKWAKTMLVVD
jgi:TRAP-type mannitol/chloroaromatic compound transport system permease small subunit